MNSDQLDREARWAIWIQAFPDGSDNLSGLLTGLLRNVSTEVPRTPQCTQSNRRQMTNRGLWIRTGWHFLSLCVHRAVDLISPQLSEK